jgi:hypothetical protein
MDPAYIKVEVRDSYGSRSTAFLISPIPFVWTYGEIIIPSKAILKTADCYDRLAEILRNDFKIPQSFIPPEECFRPTQDEEQEECSGVYRIVPEGYGESECRMEVRQAIIELLEGDETQFLKGEVLINDRRCQSLEELREELEAVAEEAGGRKRMEGEPYQPDYDVLVQQILRGYSDRLNYHDLPKKRRHVK